MRPLTQRRIVLLDAGGTLITLDYDRLRQALTEAAGPGASIPGSPDDAAFDRAEGLARRWATVAVRQALPPRGLWDGYFTRMLEGAGVDGPLVGPALEILWRMNRECGLWRRPIAGTREVLAHLRARGCRMAVVSNAEGQVEGDLVDAGFGPFLETVVDSHLVGVAKPDPRIFSIALERMGVGPDDCVYVGDVPAFDVDGARAAGIPPILVDPWDIHGDQDGVPRLRALDGLPALLGLRASTPPTTAFPGRQGA